MTLAFPEFGGPAAKPLPALPEGALMVPRRRGLYRNLLKRTLDLVAVALAAPVVVPVVAVLAFAVRRDGGGAFYSQVRVGKDGRRFRMWKLRSMVSDADAMMEDYLDAHPEARDEWNLTQKLKDDPRITPVGRLIRQTSLDELPQLWNVFIGDMSLVGPRPMMTSQQALYPGMAYYALRPGCTGYWQTAGRNRTTFEARAQYDDAYEADLTLWTDLKVLFRTVGVMLRGTGY
jgi:lipopolysaccharide/colanic/teichoic acid biosynthesis glycosyltransferase